MTMINRPCRVIGAVAALAFACAQLAFAQSAGSPVATSARTPQTAAQRRAVLLDPKRVFWSTHAPDTVTADIETSRGTVTIELIRAWAPAGVDRFYNLARAGYFDDSRMFRVLSGFIAQFGIAADPKIAMLWASQHLAADSARVRNVRGTLSYAQYTPADRTANVFVNMSDNPSLDALGFAPIGRVVQGMDIVDSLYSGYGEAPVTDLPPGNAGRAYGESNKYFDANYPKLDRIVKITVRGDSTRTPSRD